MDPASSITYRPIGVIRSPWRSSEGAPIQPSGARGVRGSVELLPELAPALADLAGFSHVILIFHCDRAAPASLTVTPFLDTATHGVFATRAPARPNPIGMSVVRLVTVRGTVLEVEDIDALDGTPLLDLKPFVPEFDAPVREVRTGWLGDKAGAASIPDGDSRFHR